MNKHPPAHPPSLGPFWDSASHTGQSFRWRPGLVQKQNPKEASPRRTQRSPGSCPPSDQQSSTGQFTAQIADSSPCKRQPPSKDREELKESRGTSGEGQILVQSLSRGLGGSLQPPSWVRSQMAREGEEVRRYNSTGLQLIKNPVTEQGGDPRGFLVAAAWTQKANPAAHRRVPPFYR